MNNGIIIGRRMSERGLVIGQFIVFDPVGMGASTYRKEGVQSANSVPLRASDRVKLTSYNRPLEYVASERYKR